MESCSQKKSICAFKVALAFSFSCLCADIFFRYGEEVYQHAPHPSTFILNPGGTFPKCPSPGHHTCLDELKADGNLQFYPDGLCTKEKCLN